MTKRIIRTELSTMCNLGRVDVLVKDLTALLEQSDGTLTYDLDAYEGWSSLYADFTIYESKEESDEIYQKRLVVEQLLKDKQIAKEKAEFERLKAKFGE